MVPSSVWFFLTFLELLLLFFLSSQLSKSISYTLFRITKNQKLTIMFLAIFFLPGVFIHEMSHLVTAQLLGVRTGKIEFMPEIHGTSVKLGSVSVEQSDILRRSLIGVAPLLLGCASLYGLSFLSQVIVSWETLKTILIGYGMFLIGNTMFSSKKDMEGVWIVVAFTAMLLGVCFYFLRIQSVGAFLWLLSHEQFFLTVDRLLLIPIVIDVCVIGGLKVVGRR